MEDALDFYLHPYDEGLHLVCIDEVPVQLVSEGPHAAGAPAWPERFDYEYVGNGTAYLSRCSSLCRAGGWNR
jgi:hypothetical protein